MKTATLFFVCSLFMCNLLFAQQKDTVSTTATATVDYYKATVGNSSLLYNGIRYHRFPYGTEGHAYYGEDSWYNGYVLYDGIQYPTRLRYDIATNVVIIPALSNDVVMIALVKRKLDAFGWDDHHFLNIHDSLPGIGPGIYEQLYNGGVTFLATKEKIIHEDLSKELRYSYSDNNNYYLRKDSVYIHVSSLNSILAILSDKKKEIQQYLKRNNIRFKSDKESAMKAIGAYYDQLKNTKP